MKKFILFSLMLILLQVSVANAQIGRGVDDFDGSVGMWSYNKLTADTKWALGDSIQINKKYEKNGEITYFIQMYSNNAEKDDMYSNEDVQIKIDKDIFSLKVVKITFNNYGYSYSRKSISSKVEVSHEVAGKLLTSQKVAMRAYFENGRMHTFDIPENVLAEWKQVIAAEK